ncbi:MAG TPA: DNA repair protein RecN [Thermoanaerobaculia bacterium]|nr:DNA repair protein RecN [Thermoanaerobaculia bacterium]
MISYLRVTNLAIVEEIAIEPQPGLNVLTGETGAGKSLLIDSLQFLNGARGTSEQVRGGAGKMVAEAVFHLPRSLRSVLEEIGIEADDHGQEIELILRRELSAAGRGRVQVNGITLTVRDLQRITDEILEIHGQNQSGARIAGRSFREMLDEWAENDALLERTRELYREWNDASARLEQRTSAQRDRAQRLDLLLYQINEITAARLTGGEEEDLRAERARLTHAEEMLIATSDAFAAISEDDLSAIAQCARAAQRLSRLGERIEEVRPLATEIEEARVRLQEIARNIVSVAESVRHDPDRLADLEDRLVVIERLRRKYGNSIEEILGYLDQATMERDELEEWESSLEKLQHAEQRALSVYRTAATELSSRRHAAAAECQATIQKQLGDLAMERTRVEVRVTSVENPDARLQIDGSGVEAGPDGFDRVEVLIAPNLGEEPRPLQKIASGGELSRLELAIAASLFKSSGRGRAATLVFDEIDAGIGGRVAEVVGRKLRQLAEQNQVICVTHLPQIASLGTSHFHVWKEDIEGRTRAQIRHLATEEERVDEIARMLAGATVSESARQHARDLLRQAAEPTSPPRKRRSAGAVS